jgi:hypothetical protein
MEARGHTMGMVSRLSQVLLVFFGFVFPMLSAFSAEVDPQYRERVAALTHRLKESGLGGEELEKVFSDDRVKLYPQILERKAKGLDYMSRRFGLFTLAVIENRRSAWAENELVELLRILQKLNKDPFSIRGSWAGAFGIAQFVPSSYARFAVDGNDDGMVDLFDFSDATASIANYLKAHGWEKDRPEKNRQAVYAYNRCDNYVAAVFTYARAVNKEARLFPPTP